MGSGQKPLVAVFGLTTSLGGIEMVMARLLPRLGDEFRIVVLDPYANEEYAKLLDGVGIERQALGPAPRRKSVGGKGWIGRLVSLVKSVPWMILTGMRLRRWAAENKPAVIYFNQAQSAAFFSRFLTEGPALIYHAHGSLGGADIRSARRLGGRFDHILAVSEWIKERLTRAGAIEKKISVVYNGVDGEDIRRQALHGSAPLPERRADEVVIVQVGVLALNKGQHLAVEALAQLPKNVSLWLCGDVPRDDGGDYRNRLVSLAQKLEVSERMRFLGWRNDVPFVIAHADVCILPSEQESFGMALVEAMVLAKPCVGTNAGGIPEIVDQERTGFVVSRDVSALAGALAQLAESAELRKKMGQAGQERACRDFSLERQGNKIAEILQRFVPLT